jgi:hypothetical protein
MLDLGACETHETSVKYFGITVEKKKLGQPILVNSLPKRSKRSAQSSHSLYYSQLFQQ